MRIALMNAGFAFDHEPVLSGVSLTVEPGKMVALMGPSGSGKTTLLRMIAGELPTNTGEIERTPDIHASWIVQSAPLLANRSALDNVALGALSVGHERSTALEIALRAMRRVQISHLASRQGHQLSGGERQRISVARSLCSGSNLLLADEPTASLDPRARETVCDAFREATSSGIGVVIATHDPYVASQCHWTLNLDQKARRMPLEA